MQKPALLLLLPAMLLMLAIPGSFSEKAFGQKQNVAQCEPKTEKLFQAKKAEAAVKPVNAKPEIEAEQKLSKADKELLARLVHAEAKGEPFKGKVAVAEVVLNRVENEKFPDTVKEVIYQENQFEPVANGQINKPAGPEAKKAVEEAVSPDKKVTEALFFYNPKTAGDTWIRTRPVIEKIGRHDFTI